MEKLWAPWRMEYIYGETPQGCVLCLDEDRANDRQRLVLYRGEHCFIMMNKFPYTNGHLMVSPFRHTCCLENLTDTEALEMHQLVVMARGVLLDCFSPQGFNIGMNLGQIAGAGIADHLHMHIVPRWSGDTNFMPVFADVRVIPQHIQATYEKLVVHFDRRAS
ncbi:MAG: HIT domain-containing protein [Desulfuromonadales bacterium]|uniref:HIT family protein n=1 Tax=Desulfuromonas sp. KJ2020 TaxID=2919173 RepID=UPI000323A001|nr:HIT domain-containing protein [Desulfuromonas sp. KJ2020]MCP3178185.1 HIT domain-containing protein [Desulfuromonas sp. KJ2020]